MAGSAAFAIVTLGLVMFLLDGWVITEMRGLPRPVIAVFDEITDFGKSGWLLFPLGLFLIGIAAASPLLPKATALVAASLTVRVSFLFVAIAVPGVFTLMVKRLIGRARPYVTGGDAYVFNPFVSGSQYASFPSGHSTTAFAAAIAIGAVWPSARVPAWLYALTIALSRVIVTAHFPSDVIASAVVGVVGALIVRDHFAARRLGFGIRQGGRVVAHPGPSWQRIKRAAKSLLQQNEVRKTP